MSYLTLAAMLWDRVCAQLSRGSVISRIFYFNPSAHFWMALPTPGLRRSNCSEATILTALFVQPPMRAPLGILWYTNFSVPRKARITGR